MTCHKKTDVLKFKIAFIDSQTDKLQLAYSQRKYGK